MKNDARFFGFTLVLIMALFSGGAIYERVLRERKEDARITKIQIVESRLDSKSPRVWIWKGAAMKPVLANWRTESAIGWGPGEPVNSYQLQGWGRKGIVWRKHFNFYRQVFQKEGYCELTLQSAMYFERLLATTKPDSK